MSPYIGRKLKHTNEKPPKTTGTILHFVRCFYCNTVSEQNEILKSCANCGGHKYSGYRIKQSKRTKNPAKKAGLK